MINHTHESISVWKNVSMTHRNPLLENISVDVCIVGGGIGGLTTAYLLSKEGKKVCILEDQEIGCGQTGQTTAEFSYAPDRRYFDLENIHGATNTKKIAQSHKSAIETVRKIIAEEKIDCDHADVNAYLFSHDKNPLILQKELEAIHRADLKEVHTVTAAPLENYDTGPALCYPNQLQLHPLRYLKGLAEAVEKNGGDIYHQTHVVEIQGGNEVLIKTYRGHTVKAKAVVVATNAPINNLFAIHTKQAPYRSYVAGFLIPRGTVHKAFYWDTQDPYHYVRVQDHSSAHDILIVGGEDHKTGQENAPIARFARLETWTKERFPSAEVAVFKWSGQVMQSIDGLGFLGRNPLDSNNVYVITGDSGTGMTHCTIGAMIINDQIMGRENPWQNLYSPSRLKWKSLGEFFKENANVAAQYGDWFARESVDEIFDLMRGQGTVITSGLKKVAVYLNEEGKMQFRSAVCPHLGGVVRWNSAEKSWDCPCHGSRFDCNGKVIEGPAFSDLEKLELKDDQTIISKPLPTPPPITQLSTSSGV